MFFLTRFRRLVTGPARFLLVNSVMFTTLFCIFSVVSLVGYAAVYQSLMPTVQLERSVHFKYAMRPCKQNELCEHPVANVVLPSDGTYPVLTSGTEYKIELALELPESDANMKMGMFMASIEMKAADGETLRSAHRSTVLVYRSKILRTLNTLLALPSLLLGQGKEKQWARLIMFDRYVEPSSKFTHSAAVEVHKPDIQIYSAKLRILADFGGIRYMMYYWPLTSAMIGITINFSCLWFLAALIWLRARLLPNLVGNSSITARGPNAKNQQATITNTAASEPRADTTQQRRTKVGEDEVDDSSNHSTGNGPLLRRTGAELSERLPQTVTNLNYVRSKMAGLIDLGFSWCPIPIPKFFVNVLLTVVSPEYSSKKHD